MIVGATRMIAHIGKSNRYIASNSAVGGPIAGSATKPPAPGTINTNAETRSG